MSMFDEPLRCPVRLTSPHFMRSPISGASAVEGGAYSESCWEMLRTRRRCRSPKVGGRLETEKVRRNWTGVSGRRWSVSGRWGRGGNAWVGRV